MSQGPTRAPLAFVIGFVAAQRIRPDRTNPPIEVNRTAQALWPGYSIIAPASRLMAYGGIPSAR